MSDNEPSSNLEERKAEQLAVLEQLEREFTGFLEALPADHVNPAKGVPSKGKEFIPLIHKIKSEIEISRLRIEADTEDYQYARLSVEELREVVESFIRLYKTLEHLESKSV